MTETENTVLSFDDEHEAFAASRNQFEYKETEDTFFSTLDQHADTLEGDVKPPLVVLGDEGSGKSAFLANWVSKRRLIKHRDEFLFQHFVGCSANNCQLAHTLFRLETALKDFFQLREMDVPDTEERLRWSLNRFLGAAAKKHSPARIVIVVDGVNNLKGEGGRDGELYWLPTELPPCVRFIVSSVEFEREQKGADELTYHRTFVELSRRQCPILRMKPLVPRTRQEIVTAFCALNADNLQLTDQMQIKISTANTSAQPLFLRSLLQAMRLGAKMTRLSTEKLLDQYLKCTTAFELIEHCLDLCSRPFFNDELDDRFADLVGKMMTVVYVSRNGLSLDELWGVIKMVSKSNEDLSHTEMLYTILKDFTMVVSGLHSFSHGIYNEVVYEKYISSSESLVRWHVLMARFFNQLPPCDRKLECLPYHLEVAGSWSKVKNCLTEIDMFELWWTPKFKSDFMKLWASLTTRNPQDESSGIGGGSAAPSSKNRPTYDIVEEYVKSLDEYRQAQHPTDEKVAETVLLIADFLIEFATGGNELNADVPALIHPMIPSDDLRSLGVPHIAVDDDSGRSTYMIPVMETQNDDSMKTAAEPPVVKQANDDFPECTTYFFHRWMWIQFPLIALGNCGKRYKTGIKVRQLKNQAWETGNASVSKKDDGMGNTGAAQSKSGRFIVKPQLTRSFSAASYKLPELKFIRKAAKTTRKIANPDDELESNGPGGDAVSKRLDAMNEEIHNLREEFDYCKQQRSAKQKKTVELKAMLKDLQLSESSTEVFDKKLQEAIKNEQKGQQKLNKSQTFHENMKKLLLMCERHPAHCDALIVEIENKLKQDDFLLSEIKKRLWEQGFERQSHNSAFRKMKTLVQEGVDMHTKLLEYRYGMKRHMQNQTSEDAKVLNDRANKRSMHRGSSLKHNHRSMVSSNSVIQMDHDTTSNGWDHMWQVISSRTGITDPDIFFQRLNNGGALEEQITSLKKGSEAKLSALKEEVQKIEKELEEVRNEASFVGTQSRDTYQKHKELASTQQSLRRVKERTESAEQLQQQVVSGLSHISDMLGVPERDDNASVHDIIKDIETVLETLVEEREKQQQGQQTANASVHSDSSSHRGLLARDGVVSPETHTRPPELEAVLSKYELPRARLAGTLPSRPVDEEGMPTERDEDDVEDDDIVSRKHAKLRSTNKLRSQQKKAARQNKDALGSTI